MGAEIISGVEFGRVSSGIAALPAVVVNDEVPVTVSAPASVIAPAELTLRLPPIVVPARSVAVLFTSVALPVPFGPSVTVPVSASRKPTLLNPLPPTTPHSHLHFTNNH